MTRGGGGSQGAPIPVEDTCADPGHTPLTVCSGAARGEQRGRDSRARSSPRGGERGSEHLGTRSAQGQGLHQPGETMGANFLGHVTCRDIPIGQKQLSPSPVGSRRARVSGQWLGNQQDTCWACGSQSALSGPGVARKEPERAGANSDERREERG